MQEQEKAAKAAAAAAAAAWGERHLSPLEAEHKLAVACEKAPTEDPVLGQLRDVFQDLERTYSEKCNSQKAEVLLCLLLLPCISHCAASKLLQPKRIHRAKAPEDKTR